jgi:YggT family protein
VNQKKVEIEVTGMAVEITIFLIKALCGLYLVMLGLRLLVRLHGGHANHPAVRQLILISTPITRPFNMVLPVIVRVETGTALAILVLCMLSTAALSGLSHVPVPWSMLLPWSLIAMLYMICDIYFVAILAQVILSWVAPYTQHPWADVSRQLSDALCGPFRRLIPNAGGIDFSPLLAIIALNVTQIVIRSWAQDLQLPADLVLGI